MKLRCGLAFVLSFRALPAFASPCIGWNGFQAPVRYSVSADDALLVRDLDGDGRPEILASGNHVDELASMSLLANRGDGTFATERLLPAGFGQELEDVGDLDRDGVPDLLLSDFSSNGIVVYRGKGRLAFDEGKAYATATHGGPSRIVDEDRDGIADLVSLSFGSGNPVRLHLFHGRSDGTLDSRTTFDTTLANGATPSLRIINGALEILVAEHSGHLGLIRHANGQLFVSRLSAGPGLDLSCTFGDVNGDGIADIIDAGEGVEGDAHESIFVTLGNADGSFRERKQLASPGKALFPVEVRVGDVDGDGHADLLVEDFRATNLYFYRGNGAGDFAEGVAIDAGGPINAFDLADVNGDGHPDVVTANNDHTVSVLINRGPCVPPRRRAVRK